MRKWASQVVLIHSRALLIYPLVHPRNSKRSEPEVDERDAKTKGEMRLGWKWKQKEKVDEKLARGIEKRKKWLIQYWPQILPRRLLEWCRFKPVRKMEAPPQSAFEAAREIGHVWAPNPWNVSTALSPPATQYILLSARVHRCGHHETEPGRPVQRLGW